MKYKVYDNGIFYNENCFDVFKKISDNSIDMILADLPYGTTACKWDTILPFDLLWKEYHRVAKNNAAIVLTASQPFTSNLIMSNIKNFKYCWVWDKVNRITGSLLSNKMPMKRHEDICVFYKHQSVYNKQYIMKPRIVGGRKHAHGKHVNNPSRIIIEYQKSTVEDVPHNPNSIISIKGFITKDQIHPTQKPVALFEYLIKTYTNEGMTVLDNVAGSGTTAIAANNLNRKWICIEKEAEYYDASLRRIDKEITRI